MKELFEDNDELVILRVIDSGTIPHKRPPYLFAAEKLQLESEGHGGEKAYQVEARRLLDSVISENKDEKAVVPFSSPILMLVKRHCGISSRTIPRSSPTDGIIRLPSLTDAQIEIYSPDSLIVGTRGRDGAIGGLLPGSMSKSPPPQKRSTNNRYCLQHSPVPVIVVHPSQRRLHRKHKREKDPDRQSYIHLLKLAKAYNSSSDSLAHQGLTFTQTDRGVDTPDTVSPEGELAQTRNDSIFDEHEGSEAERPTFRHSVTAPGRVDSPSRDAEIALERETENVSPRDKG